MDISAFWNPPHIQTTDALLDLLIPYTIVGSDNFWIEIDITNKNPFTIVSKIDNGTLIRERFQIVKVFEDGDYTIEYRFRTNDGTENFCGRFAFAIVEWASYIKTFTNKHFYDELSENQKDELWIISSEIHKLVNKTN